MVSVDTFRKLALSFPGAVELPHFEKTSFRVNKKIFASLDTSTQIVAVKLSEVDQSVFCSHDPEVIYPVKGGWGKQGYTNIVLKKINKQILLDALTLSYDLVNPKKTKPLKKKKP